jgi:hydroxyacid-oxoacid transhydrogenase
MSCCHYYSFADGGDTAFSIDAPSIIFGPGMLKEIGDHAQALGVKRAVLFTDKGVATLPYVSSVLESLRKARIDCAVYDEVKVEPTDQSFLAAARFASEGKFDGFISLGGGSVIDTTKAANLYSTYPAEFLAYVNAPVGEARAVPGALKPHIACPTTSGTGSECTGIAVFDYLALRAKTGIASRRLRPTLALIDPDTTATLTAGIVAASGFDVLCHALESYTAIPYTKRARPERASLRPMSQGANPWSDMGCEKALTLTGKYMERAARDAADTEARSSMMWAATLAGSAFGNAGVHVPHGMSYSVAGMVKDYRAAGYPQEEPLIPHGMSVIVNAPAAFRFTAPACPHRHLRGAKLLGAEVRDATPQDAGEIVAEHLIKLMRATGIPNGLSGVGYSSDDIAGLTEGAYLQQRLLRNAPIEITKEHLGKIFGGAIRYW